MAYTYFGFSQKNTHLSNGGFISHGIWEDLCPLHVLLTSYKCKIISHPKSYEFYSFVPVQIAKKIFELLVKVSQDSKKLSKQISHAYYIFNQHANKYKYAVTAYNEILELFGKASYAIDSIKHRIKIAEKALESTFHISAMRGSNVIFKGLSYLSYKQFSAITDTASLLNVSQQLTYEVWKDRLEKNPKLFTGIWQ